MNSNCLYNHCPDHMAQTQHTHPKVIAIEIYRI